MTEELTNAHLVDRSGFIANVGDVVAKHKPPSEADLLERWNATAFQGGDIQYFWKCHHERLAKSVTKLREYEAMFFCECEKCEKKHAACCKSWLGNRCTCGADAHNARIDALLGGKG